MRKNKSGQNAIFIEVRPTPTYSIHGHPLSMEFWTLFFIRSIDYTNDSLIYNLRVDPTTLGVPTYALHLNRTWIVGPPTNQPNPIQRNMTINKI